MSISNTLPVKKNEKPAWDLELSSKHKLLDFKIKEIIQYRDLIWLFIKRDFSTQYKQTILAPFGT